MKAPKTQKIKPKRAQVIINEILKDPNFKDFEIIFDLPSNLVYPLCAHTSRTIRYATLLHIPDNDLALFVGDSDQSIQQELIQRFKKLN